MDAIAAARARRWPDRSRPPAAHDAGGPGSRAGGADDVLGPVGQDPRRAGRPAGRDGDPRPYPEGVGARDRRLWGGRRRGRAGNGVVQRFRLGPTAVRARGRDCRGPHGDRADSAPILGRLDAFRACPAGHAAHPKRRAGFQPGPLALCGSVRYTTAPGTFPSIVRRIPAARAIMAKIHFVDHSGAKRTVDIENGATVMEGAIRNAIPGIEAECGGACACATCHVYVDEAWREKVGAPSPMEEDMLDFGFDVRPNSRLSCQIKVSDALDGLVVSTPERQA